MSTVYYDNLNGFSQIKMEGGKLFGRLNSGEWQEIETGGEQGEPGAPGADGVSAYVYWSWCSDPATGAGFSLTDPADYISFITRNTVLVSPQFSDFSTWVKYVGSDGKDGADGVSTYVYYAYASDADGTNFSLSPADGLNFQAILVTHTEIASPSLSDFAGMFYQYKDVDVKNLNPIGTVIAYAGITAPEGFIACNGAAVSRETYANLFAAIGTLYGEGDGSTTFNLPDLTDRVVQGSATAGTVLAAGVPNISGTMTERAFVRESTGGKITLISQSSGAFRTSTTSFEANTVVCELSSTRVTDPAMVSFDASKSNAIYGNSNTVQPPALTMIYCIKY
ncbi:MAG: tail fiber protein [Lentisphaeria bacterium]|nr:tail fiber protein [Lentisphaeria bacterium]